MFDALALVVLPLRAAQISVESTKLPDVGVAHLCGHPLLYTNFLTQENKVLKTQVSAHTTVNAGGWPACTTHHGCRF